MEEEEEELNNFLRRANEQLVLRQRPFRAVMPHAIPHLVNIVTTVSFLPQPPPGSGIVYRLPLLKLAAALKSAQYAPKVFAANMIKFKDLTGNVTMLLFGTGNCVMVGGRTLNHSRFFPQFLRVILENVECLMISPDDHLPRKVTLKDRTVFQGHTIHNIVASDKCGFNIDLKAMNDVFSGCCKWDPSKFPGLKAQVWLNDEYRCLCREKRKQIRLNKLGGGDHLHNILKPLLGKLGKCECKCRVLAYQNQGRFVITGARDAETVNRVSFRFRGIAQHFRTDREQAPRDERYLSRIRDMLAPMTATTASEKKSNVLQLDDEEDEESDSEDEEIQAALRPEDALANVLNNLSLNFNKSVTTTTTTTNNISPLGKLALEGRVEAVVDMLNFVNVAEEVPAVLALLQQIPEKTQEQREVARILTECIRVEV
jgi:TATA-box binding protein (TBP) (component of TFIID and TFIIIB)